MKFNFVVVCMTWELVELGKNFIIIIINGFDLVFIFLIVFVDDFRFEVL